VFTQIGNNVVEWATDAFWTSHKIKKVSKAYEAEIEEEIKKINPDMEGDAKDKQNFNIEELKLQ